MNHKTLFFFVFLLLNSFSSFSLSPTQNDTGNIKKPTGEISEMDQNQLMLLDATVELDQALLAGVNASLDTLNLPMKNSTGKMDTVERLRLMKRERERTEMKTYLEYMKDSLATECTRMQREKESIQTRLGLKVDRKDEVENLAGRKPQEIKNNGVVAEAPVLKKMETNYELPAAKKRIAADTVHTGNLTDNKAGQQVKTGSSRDSLVVQHSDKDKNEADVAVKKEKKHGRHKNQNSMPTDTIFARNNNSATTIKPVAQIKTASSPDTSIENRQPPLVKADVLQDRRPAIDTANRNVSGTPDTAVRIKSRYYTTYAQKAIVEKNYPAALDYLNSSIQFWKDNYDAWFTRAAVEEQAGKLDMAMEDYYQCYRIDSTQPTLFYNMALLNLKLNNRDKAISELNKAIALNNRYFNAYMKRAALYNDTANYKAAIADYDRILNLNRNYYYAYKGRGISKLMQRNFKAAIDDFTRYIIYDQSDAEVYYYRGLAKINNNEWLDGCLELSMSANMGYAAAAVAQKKNCE